MAKMTDCRASSGHHWVTRLTASTTVVIQAASLGPRGSTGGPADMCPPDLDQAERGAGRTCRIAWSAGRWTEARLNAAEVHRAAPGHHRIAAAERSDSANS